jgi:hypothetical protein
MLALQRRTAFIQMHETKAENPGQRGRSAIEAAHAGLAKEDESRFDAKISQIYGVDIKEAEEIHADYHEHRLLALLEKRALEYGMTREAFYQKEDKLDWKGISLQVSKGWLAEAAAVDIMFKSLYAMESKGRSNDRYVNFYG